MSHPVLRGVIFDMDGVLTDSEPAFYAAVNDILARYGKHIGEDEYRQFIGQSTEQMWTQVIALKGIPETLEEIVEDYEAPLMVRLREPRPPLPGARELLAELRARGVPVALCTASFMRWVEAILASADVLHTFDALSTADMVERTKPHPDPYLMAAQKLGLPPAECIAIEDSKNGVASAMAAGTYVLQLRATSSSADPQPGVRAVLGSLAEFPLGLLDGRDDGRS